MEAIVFCGRQFGSADLELIVDVVERYGSLSREGLAKTVCELLEWQRSGGGLKARECREFLERLDREGKLKLPALRIGRPTGRATHIPISAEGEPVASLQGQLSDFDPLVLEPVQDAPQNRLYRELIGRYHYLGHKVPFGAQQRYLFRAGTQLLGCMQFSSPAWRMAPREEWIGWDEPTRRNNLQHVVNQSRFLILPWVRIHNLASAVLSRAQRRLGRDWQARYGIEPLLIETLVDESRYSGHCYRAANWIRLGQTRGRGRMDSTHQREGAAPKAVWVYPRVPDAAQRLRRPA